MSSSVCEKPPASLSPGQAGQAGQPGLISSELPAIYLDNNGDLRLQAGSETEDPTQDFVVCSEIVARSSPVWKAMLFGGFKESKPTEGEWVVPLPEENPKALLTVLNIIHGRLVDVPKEPSVEELYLILAITHKYDMVDQVQPWAALWSRVVDSTPDQGKGDVAQLIFIAWELGQQKVFENLVDSLVTNCSVDADGRLQTPKGRRLDEFDHFGPPDLIATIAHVRKTTIQCLLNLIAELVRSLTSGLQCSSQKPLPRNDADRLACDSLILGSFWKATVKERGTLFPSLASEITNEVHSLAVEIFNALGGITCSESHKECNPAESLQKQVLDTIRRRQSAVTSDHLKYMKIRRKELGLPDIKSVKNKLGRLSR